MASACQLLGAGQAGRAGTDHGHFLAGLAARWLGRYPALRPALVDNGVLDGLDAHRVVVDVQGTGGFAGGGAHATGELGEVVVECSTSSARSEEPTSELQSLKSR